MSTKIVNVRTVAPEKPAGMEDGVFDKIVNNAFQKAIEKTADLDPDLETLQGAIEARQSAFEQLLQAAGLEINFSVVRRMKVREDEIMWEVS